MDTVWKTLRFRTDAAIPDNAIKMISDMHDFAPFLWAVVQGDTVEVKRCIRHQYDLHHTNQISRNGLHLATFYGHLEIVDLLLDAGFDPNTRDGMGNPPIYYAVLNTVSSRIVTLLFHRGAVMPPRQSNTDLGLFLEFVLMMVPTEEEIRTMKVLLENGAVIEDPEAPGGHQVLHYAAMANNPKLIKILFQLGANLYSKNSRRMTPRDVAIVFNCKKAETLLGKYMNAKQKKASLT